MPIDRFKGIHIVIDPPSTDDPGQVVRGWLQSIALVTALIPRFANPYTIPETEKDFFIPDTRLSARLPPVTIQVRNGTNHKWHTEGSWNKTLHHFPVLKNRPSTVLQDERAFSDLKTILTPLARLRNADAIEFELPSAAPVESDFQDFLDSLVLVATEEKLFGLNLNSDFYDNDDDIQCYEDALHVWFDLLLDDMRGPSAAELRRDRFKFWCSEYEHQLGRRFNGLWRDLPGGGMLGGACWYLDHACCNLVERKFHDRFMSAREHVLAAHRNILRSNRDILYLPLKKEEEFWFHHDRIHCLGLESELGDDETFWEVCYPSGIKPESENYNWESTEHIRIPYRLEAPKDESDDTASQIFPPDIAGCKHCDQDTSERRRIVQKYEFEREATFDFSSRHWPQVFGPSSFGFLESFDGVSDLCQKVYFAG
ncbi:hypothetical protein PV08_01593 [Exophiala spinifera]|uniref:Uncharacterized protein n=1 Tax=Exophiala spinifera TaxID=91928 RepID=A0A0D2CC32_9EURO|nr:uncharacterized protein PV08_01593 [Exophiala spinifera]KIW21014.1 hypothetical protein PV08_01593 [Exophiala spinifera]